MENRENQATDVRLLVSVRRKFTRQYQTNKKKQEYTPKNYNFACCLYGCETLSLILKEERRLRGFKNRVLTSNSWV
jgi:hypothetical protein